MENTLHHILVKHNTLPLVFLSKQDRKLRGVDSLENEEVIHIH